MDQRGAKAFILKKLRYDLPEGRTYHSLEHTLDVLAAVIDIAAQEGVTDQELELLKTAALYHDAGFTVQDEDHEVVSCGLARESLPAFGYAPEQEERICSMIMATKIPQSPGDDKLARILCDADLDYLGRPDFFRIGDELFAEMKRFGRLSTEREWNELQVSFLQGHTYFTATNIRDRQPAKLEHLAAVQRWLKEHP